MAIGLKMSKESLTICVGYPNELFGDGSDSATQKRRLAVLGYCGLQHKVLYPSYSEINETVSAAEGEELKIVGGSVEVCIPKAIVAGIAAGRRVRVDPDLCLSFREAEANRESKIKTLCQRVGQGLKASRLPFLLRVTDNCFEFIP